jgi:hypothetical protein
VLVLWLAFTAIGLVLYSPVLNGDFISDDSHYVVRNAYVHDLTWPNVVAIWSPTSEVAVLVENYAPVHLMLHSFEWQLFGPDVTGYHVVNVVLHALAAALLVPVFRRSGIGLRAAAMGALFFLVHPAQVESVAWISQLKSASALVLSLGALLLHPARPAAALVLFALALFAKPFSAFALPVVATFGWLRRRHAAASGEATPDFRWPWLVGWGAVVIGFAVAESLAFSQSAGLAPPLYADLAVRYRTIFAVALRYLVMAISGTGLSTFHEPPPVTSWLDPMFLGGLAAVVALGARTVFALRADREEAVYWLWAAISFAPLSGVLPLPYPMADRYLYFVLPGLIGAVCLAWRDTVVPACVRFRGEAAAAVAGKAATAAVAALVLWLGAAAFARAPVFRSAETLMADAERHYPDGAAAHTRAAGRAAAAGDHAAAVAHLRAAWARGYNRVDHLIADPRYAVLEDDPDFIALKHEMADDWIGRMSADPEPTHYKARALAQAYVAKGDLEAAARVIEDAIRRPGPITESLEQDLEELRRRIRFEKRIEAVRRAREAGR